MSIPMHIQAYTVYLLSEALIIRECTRILVTFLHEGGGESTIRHMSTTLIIRDKPCRQAQAAQTTKALLYASKGLLYASKGLLYASKSTPICHQRFGF